MKKNTASQVGFGTQIRRSPFFNATEKWGAEGYSVYNHMYIPRSFGDPEQNFWNLVNHAILCDVSVERQVEITGPDAAKFVQYLTPRNLANCSVGQCKYVFITDNEGGIINDPVLLKLAQDHYWLSLSDSDVLLWAKGVQVNSCMNVTLREPDVSPLQLQGPKSRDIMVDVFGDWINELRYFWFREVELDGIPLIVSRTGWSSELGYEIFLRDASRGDELWEHLMRVGEPLGLKPGHTSTIRRIEGGMLSYIADMSMENNPFELGQDRLVDLDMEAEFIGKSALKQIKAAGIKRLQIGMELHCEPMKNPNQSRWPLLVSGREVGEITSAVYSPRLKKNIGLGLIEVAYASVGSQVTAETPFGLIEATVVEKPFYDPKKSLASK